ncbi:MAG: hypothetical protein K6T55_02990 [Syntrophobacterales bacterium]|nr:hypothetical protein [Syntrophobacterales bacterium]
MTLNLPPILRMLLLGLAVALAPASPGQTAPPEGVVDLPPELTAPGEVILQLTLALPPGWQLTPDAPQSVRLNVQEPQVLRLTPGAAAALRQPRFPLSLPLTAAPGRTVLRLDLVLNLCRSDGKGMCLIREVRLLLPVTVAAGAPSRPLEVTVPLGSF